MIKKYLLLIIGLILLFSVCIILILGCLFLQPQWFIKQTSLVWVLDRWAPFEYHLESFEFRHQRNSLFDREIAIEVTNFNIASDELYEAHLQHLEIFGRISWNGQWKFHSPQSNTIVFDRIAYKAPQDQVEQKPSETTSPPISLKEKWQLFWNDIYPEFKLVINEVDIQAADRHFIFPLEIFRNKNNLNLQFFELELQLTPDSLSLSTLNPEKLVKFIFPESELPAPNRAHLTFAIQEQTQVHPLNVEVESHQMELTLATHIPDIIVPQSIDRLIEEMIPSLEIHLRAPEVFSTITPFLADEQKKMLIQLQKEQQLKAQLNASLQGYKSENGLLKIEMQSLVDFEVNQLELRAVHNTKTSFSVDTLLNTHHELIPDLLTGTTVELKVEQLKQRWEKMKNVPFELPAPLNSLEGNLALSLGFVQQSGELLTKLDLSLDLEGHGQNLNLKTFTTILLNKSDITDLKGPIETVIQLERVNLRLPQLQASSSPPQLLPDSRIQTVNKVIETKNPPATTDRPEINLQLKATKDSPVTVATNLLNEKLRFVFDLNIEKGEIKKGLFELLPLQLEIFRRQMAIKQLEVTFQAPRLPQVRGLVQFKLPQYLIELHLEGTTEQIRHHFTSSPPLPQGDIFAVLLFGRPLTDLSESDRTASNQTQQYLSDGLLSLSLLYFLSGGPIESIGFNPETGAVSAQVGLTDKSSLRVSTSTDGQNTASVRRSLGKGWYIDTSVQRSSQPTHGSQQDYGVLLERIMAY